MRIPDICPGIVCLYFCPQLVNHTRYKQQIFDEQRIKVFFTTAKMNRQRQAHLVLGVFVYFLAQNPDQSKG